MDHLFDAECSGMVPIILDSDVCPNAILSRIIYEIVDHKYEVIMCSLNWNANRLKIALNKQSQRPSEKLHFIEIGSHITDNLSEHFEEVLLLSVSDLVTKLYVSKIVCLIDDVQIICNGQLHREISFLRRLKHCLRDFDQFNIIFGTRRRMEDYCFRPLVYFEISTVGTGFEKSANGMMSSATIPEKFYGKFVLERSENFDQYLAAKGVNWLLRKMIGMSSITKMIERVDNSHYNFHNLSPKSNIVYENFSIGEEFEGKGFDGKQHKILFGIIEPDTLTERHIRVDNPADKGETYKYNIDGDYLILTLESGDIVCRRFLKRA